MPRFITTYRLFIASPGDVQRERDAMQGVVNEINRILDALMPDESVSVELLMWEKSVTPQIGDGPQVVVNGQIESYDIFLGLLAKRFGTPTHVAGSGTEEEFRNAYENWRKHGMPWIVFFVNTRVEPPNNDGESVQMERVNAFRSELESKGILGKYDGAELFASTVLHPLLQIIGRLIRQSREVRSTLAVTDYRSKSPASSQPVPLDKKLKVVSIGERDACFLSRDKYIGKTGVLLEAQQRGEWLRGTFLFDAPLFPGDDRRYNFLQVKVTVDEA